MVCEYCNKKIESEAAALSIAGAAFVRWFCKRQCMARWLIVDCNPEEHKKRGENPWACEQCRPLLEREMVEVTPARSGNGAK